MRCWIFQKYFPEVNFLVILAFLFSAQVCFGNTAIQDGEIKQADQKQTLDANNKTLQSLPQTTENKASQEIIKGQCDIIKKYESLCDTQKPNECAGPIDDTRNPENRQTWWDYANLCID